MFTEMQQMRGVSGQFAQKAPTDPRLAMAEFIAKQKKMQLSPYVANPQALPNTMNVGL